MKVPVLFLGTRFTGAPDRVPAVVLVAVCAAVLSALSGCAPWFGNRKGSAREMSLSEMAAHGDVAALARMGSLRSARLAMMTLPSLPFPASLSHRVTKQERPFGFPPLVPIRV